jgi:CheY-like chemotaxis protein/anti-sigma regulatory factor (Ser/Thr protein kinase)
VLADPDRLRQVVWNVVNNAVKFTPGGGRVSVRLARPGGRVRVVVRDTGRGIDPQFLPHVFDRFRQEDASCTREAGGLGLGMAIARQLVELHGGTIRAQSDGEGKGSTFTVELPLPDPRGGGASPARPRPQRRRSGAGRPASRPVPPALGGLRVLLVDDQPDNRSAFRLVLEAYGAAVDEAETADRALAVFGAALAAGEPFGLLVCDVGLPGRDGYDLIRAVRAVEREHGRAVAAPALALTAYARPEDRQRASDAGFQAHLTKPAEPADLVATLVALAGSRPGVPGDRR